MLAKGLRARRWRAAMAIAAASALVCASPRAAVAQIVDEVWVGAFAHDVTDLGRGRESDGADLELEIDTVKPAVLRFLGAPRVNATIALNSAGLTNFGGVGLVWDRRLAGRLYGSLQFGVDYTDGVTDVIQGPAGDDERHHRLLLGTRTLFREAAGLNWRLSDRWSVGGEFIHLSNGGLVGHHHNQGLNDLGLRLGYRFR
jgi:lipid A 3-O-deacylase